MPRKIRWRLMVTELVVSHLGIRRAMVASRVLRSRQRHAVPLEDLVALMERLGERPPASSCVTRSLVMCQLIDRTLRPQLVMGAERNNGTWALHAWVEVAGQILGERGHYRPIAQYVV